jgi:hypothetical protein
MDYFLHARRKDTIVLVHGIAQEQKSADILEAEWLPALAGGVRNAGFPAVADTLWRDRAGPGGLEARMAFYGHLFRRPDSQGESPGDLTPEQAEIAEALAVEWLEHAAGRSTRERDRRLAGAELASVCPVPGQEAMGVPATARTAINAAARLPWFARVGMAFAERFVVRALVQVTRYLTEDAIREAAQRSVFYLIGPKTRAVVAHSLGSVVAYEAVHAQDRPIPLLVTLGSPLGLDAIVLPRLRPPASFPPQVARWVNVADRDDVVAAAPDLSVLFSAKIPEGAKLEGDWVVDNGADPHNACSYLGSKVTGRAVNSALACTV